MRITFNAEKQTLTAGPLTCRAWSKVRNELNGYRLLTSVAVKTVRENGEPGVPYMPREFPKGVWRITGVHEKSADDPYLYPWFISTDAHQSVEEWSTKYDGSYAGPTGRMVEDFDYGLHYSVSGTTLGCIRIERRDDVDALVELLRPALRDGPVELEVV